MRRGLVSGTISQEHPFTSFARSVLLRFHSDLLSLFRTLDNRCRRALVGLVERASKAVALVDETERAMILNTLRCE